METLKDIVNELKKFLIKHRDEMVVSEVIDKHQNLSYVFKNIEIRVASCLGVSIDALIQPQVHIYVFMDNELLFILSSDIASDEKDVFEIVEILEKKKQKTEKLARKLSDFLVFIKENE